MTTQPYVLTEDDRAKADSMADDLFQHLSEEKIANLVAAAVISDSERMQEEANPGLIAEMSPQGRAIVHEAARLSVAEYILARVEGA